MASRANEYKKHTPLEHILARPDTYVGSVEPETEKQWVFNDANCKMEQKSITYVPGLYKIYDEILVNAIDQCTMDTTIDAITIDVDKENGSICVMNTGKGIPVEVHPEYKIYIPELIFGELLTSSNYDDTKERTTGGRNGYGAKLANIFSKTFTVETQDVQNGLHYIQTFSDNMRKKEKAKITKKKSQKGFAKFTFTPDLSRFGLKEFTDDMVALFQKRAYDACACTPSKVKVSYNGEQINVKTFEKYVDLYIGAKTETPRVHEVSKCGRWEVVVAMSPDNYKQVSFVNGISTIQGGTHVESINRQIINKVTDYIQARHKQLTVKPQFIRDHLFVFVKAVLINPTFSSQTKVECTSKANSFGSKMDIDDEYIKKIGKLGIINEAIALAKHKEMRELNKTDGKKRLTLKDVPKLDDANKAGSIKSNKCTLILTEGDSAKTFAISGLSVVGRDFYGVFPLRGKMLNVREATAKQLLENAEVNAIKKIMGLQHGKVYNDTSELRYGNIMVITDADADGSHIKGLLFNFIHHFWPSLMKIQPNFVRSMITPIVKATKGSEKKEFYSMKDYNEWKAGGTQGWNVKYYKGLGTSTSAEAKEYFKNLGKNVVEYRNDDMSDASIELAFKKTMTDERKSWILKSILNNETIPHDQKRIPYSDFIHKDLVWFSIADNIRSIPCVVDGLKPSQRKVLHACRMRQNTEIKVSQLAGFVSTKTSYHHGEASLMGTIINMAQNFVGSNTYNLLQPRGQFGSRLMGGKDAASPRYIFTRLSEHASRLFVKADDPILEYLDDDGQKIEPKFFVPIMPLILINGGEGIGTGYSSSVPCYNPDDIKKMVIGMLNGNIEGNDIHPWYPKFKGTITPTGDGTYQVTGCYNLKAGTLEITELPIGKWTNDYKEFLDSLVDNKIVNYENHSTEDTVYFKIRMNTAQLSHEKILKDFKLTGSINTTNMHLFDAKGNIKKYRSPREIVKDFVDVRLHHYDVRKKYQLKKMSVDLNILTQKITFIRLIVNEELVIYKKKKDVIMSELKKRKFSMVDGGYDYLLKMELYNLTDEKINELDTAHKKIKLALDTLEKTSIQDIWMQDLA
jgi:DNA topoisomerase-2